MPQFTFRLAATEDLPVVRRLQKRLMDEIQDPVGINEAHDAHSEFILVEASDHRGTNAIALTSLLRASAQPFIFEKSFPAIWDRIDLRTLTGRADIRREDLVEYDWVYVEPEYRRQRIGVTAWAGSMLLAHYRKNPVCVVTANLSNMAVMADAFRTVGLSTHLGNDRYELGHIYPAQIADPMAALVRRMRERDPSLLWQIPSAVVL